MATHERPRSKLPHVFISYRPAVAHNGFVSHLLNALKRDEINVFVDQDESLGKDLGTFFNRIEESKIALVILSSRYTESSWCLDELVKIKERAEEGKLVVVPVFYKLNASVVKGLKGDFGFNLWDHVKRTSEFDKLKNWKEALDFVSRKIGFVLTENSGEIRLIFDIIKHVKREVSHLSCHVKSDVYPKEADSVQTEVQFPGKLLRGDILDLRKDDNFLGETDSDATPKLQSSAESDSVVSVSEEKKQGNVSENTTMATYNEHRPQYQIFINFRGPDLRHGFVSHLEEALKNGRVNVFNDKEEKMGEDVTKLFKRIEESKIALVIFSSRYAESQWCLDELVKIKECMDEGKLLVIPIFYKMKSSQVRHMGGCFGDDFYISRVTQWEEALKSVAARPGFVLDDNSDEADLITSIVQISLEQIEKSHDRRSEQLEDARSEDLKGVDGERDGILWDRKSDRSPKEAEIVQAEAKSRRDNGLNLRKGDNILDETNSDATSKLQDSAENSTVYPFNEEKKQGDVSKNTTMTTYDGHPPHHQVFINFRGVDLRRGFITHLVEALKKAKVNVFIDTYLKQGVELTNLFERIEESRIALVIFSSRYADSRWCLDELVKIKECMDEGKLLVIPIFYKVEPSEVEQLKGNFGVKFWNLWRINRDCHIIKWKEALKSVASLMGFYLREHSSEREFITVAVQKVVDRISLREGERTELPTGKGVKYETYFDKHNLVGMAQRLEQLEQKLEFDCNETRIIGVVGMPGIGKTTLAMMLHEKWNCKFIRCLPLLGIRKKSEDYGPVWLRKTLLEVLLEGMFSVISNNTTHESVKVELLQSKIFAVLDDVSNKEQLEFLLADLDWIKKGSKIVVTTSDKSLLKGFVHDTYVVPQLNYNESFELFKYHAFGDQICSLTKTFVDLSRMFVEYTRGHPLTIKILGMELREKNKAHWIRKLESVTELSNTSIQDVWRSCIDQLNHRQKDVFLDIVCFFKSEDEYFVRSLLDSGDADSTDAVSEVRDLANKFLITISDGRVEMHDLLYTFGKDLGSPERHKLWNYKDIIDKLLNMEKSEANNVRGIFVDMSKITEGISMERMTFGDMLNLRYFKIYDSCCPRQCKADYKLDFPDGLELPLDEVRYLHWVKFPLEELPSDFRPKNLVDLRLPYSKIKRVWQGVKDTPRLKWVDVSHSSKLLDLSALSKAENLQRLNLEGCKALVELPMEFQNMKSLNFLNLRGCIRLSCLAEMNLISLKILILSGCANLKEFQLISESLEVLHLDGTAIKELPPTIKKLQRLVFLNLKNCEMLEYLPKCLRELKVIKELILSGCSRLKNLSDFRESMKHLQSLLIDRIGAKDMPKISCDTKSEDQVSADILVESIGLRKWPHGVTGVFSLQRLSMSGNDFVSLQTGIAQLYNLKWLDLKQCKKLRSVPMLPPRLQYFNADGCDSLKRVANPLALPGLSEQIHATFNFSNCNKLDQDAKDSIISYTQRRSELVLDELTRYNGGLVLEASIGTCFPGWEIPMWFSHQAFGSVLKPKLPPHWCDNRFTGIALCAVILFPAYHEQRHRLLVQCNCVFNNEDGSRIHFSCTIGSWTDPSSTPGNIEPSHVFIGYTGMLDIKKHGEEEDEKGCSHTEASFKFQVTDGTEVLEGCEVLKCGFSLVYGTDERENICSDVETVVIPEKIVNIPVEARSNGNFGSHNNIQWNYKDIIDKLTKMQQPEASDVRGIILDMSELTESIALECMIFINMRNLLYLKIYDSYCPWQRKADCNLYFPDGLEFPLEEIRYLHWVEFPLEELPPDFIPGNLVDLRLPYSKIERIWEGATDTPQLKWVDLSHSSKLLDLSALSKAENLQRLNLEGCTSLDELPVGIQNMKSLVYLNLRGCIRLCDLPKMNLISLKTLILSDCSNLKEFQLISENVEFLHLDGTSIKGLPPGIQNLRRLALLNLKNCRLLECLPNCLSNLKVLDELILSGCSRLKNLPDVRNSLKHLQILLLDGIGAEEMPNISCFTGSEGPTSADMFLQLIGSHGSVREWPCGVNGVSSLRRLCLSGNDFVILQPDIGQLYNLKWLDVKQCKKLRCVPVLPPRLQYFNADGCVSLERVANPLVFPMLSEHMHAIFNFSNCNKLDQDAKDNILSYIRWKSQLVLDELSRFDGGLVSEAFIGTCFPGWEVPTWFSHQASGSVLEPKLPPHWCDNRFIGIALCAVIIFPAYHEQRHRLLVKCNCVFNNEDGSRICFSCTIGSWTEPSGPPGKIEPSHVFIGYTSMLDIKKHGEEDDEEKCVCTETSVEFQVTDGMEEIKGCEVLKCGFSLVYAPEERENICSDSKSVVIPIKGI